jgi:acetyltransferase
LSALYGYCSHTWWIKLLGVNFEHSDCQGLGTQLLQQLLQVGRDEHLTTISADILADNYGMQKICAKVGFRITRTADPTVMKAEIIV